MKKKNRVLVCILSAMVSASCLATPALAAESATPSEAKLTENVFEITPEMPSMEEAVVVSQTTKQLSLTEPNMVQHEEVTTVYEDGSQTVVTLTAHSIPDSPSATASWKNIQGTASGKVYGSNKTLLATITVNGEFRYDSANQLVERTKYSKTEKLNDSQAKIRRCTFSIDTGRESNGTTWAYVRANYRIDKNFMNFPGYVELKCDSNGKITSYQKSLQPET